MDLPPSHLPIHPPSIHPFLHVSILSTVLSTKIWAGVCLILPSRGSWELLGIFLPQQMRELRHENVTTCLGFFMAPGLSALVLEYCVRGSLEELLRNESLRLDWTFKASLLLDLIRVRNLPGLELVCVCVMEVIGN